MTSTRIEQKVQTTLSITPRLQQAIRLLQLSANDLSAFIHEQAVENPLLNIESVAKESSSLPDSDFNKTNTNDDSSEEGLFYKETHNDCGDHGLQNNKLRSEQTLQQYLTQQLSLWAKNQTHYAIGLVLIDHLNESGYLDANIEDIANQLYVSEKQVLIVLKAMQNFDPIGIFARSVQECLQIQLQEQNLLTNTMKKVLDNLGDMLATNPHQLAKKCDLTLPELQSCLAQLRKLNPRPASGFLVSHAHDAIIPDGFVKKTGNQFAFELNFDVVPRVLLNNSYYHELRQYLKKPEERQFLQEKLAHANWLVQSLHQRFITLQQVGSAIVEYQQDFFEKGAAGLKPLTLKMISTQLDIHESTVSRITTAKYIHTPRGTYELKFFFNQSLISISEDSTDVSAKSVQDSIMNIIRHESTQNPFSDEQIVAKLGEEGMLVARRTIAKYRGILNIPSSSVRRNQYIFGIKKTETTQQNLKVP